jgi:hypothetical protein
MRVKEGKKDATVYSIQKEKGMRYHHVFKKLSSTRIRGYRNYWKLSPRIRLHAQ